MRNKKLDNPNSLIVNYDRAKHVVYRVDPKKGIILSPELIQNCKMRLEKEYYIHHVCSRKSFLLELTENTDETQISGLAHLSEDNILWIPKGIMDEVGLTGKSGWVWIYRIMTTLAFMNYSDIVAERSYI